MKKIMIAILVLVCIAAFLPASFAGAEENSRTWFQPTLRVGYLHDVDDYHCHLSRSTPFLGVTDIDLKLDGVARPYYALELPFSVTDRLKVTLRGDYSSTSSDRLNGNTRFTNPSTTLVARTFETDDTAYWLSTEGLVSFAFIKNLSFVKDLSVLAGVRYDYFRMRLESPQGFVTAPSDWLKFRKETWMPVFGLSGTFTPFKKGIWGGDMNLSVLYGPMEWGWGDDVDYEETINAVNDLVYEGDIDKGYIVKLSGDVTILSSKLTPWMEGSVAIFGQFTWTDMSGDGELRDLSQPFVRPRGFEYDDKHTVGIIGLSVSLAF